VDLGSRDKFSDALDDRATFPDVVVVGGQATGGRLLRDHNAVMVKIPVYQNGSSRS
jgi:hypothetical protein